MRKSSAQSPHVDRTARNLVYVELERPESNAPRGLTPSFLFLGYWRGQAGVPPKVQAIRKPLAKSLNPLPPNLRSDCPLPSTMSDLTCAAYLGGVQHEKADRVRRLPCAGMYPTANSANPSDAPLADVWLYAITVP